MLNKHADIIPYAANKTLFAYYDNLFTEEELNIINSFDGWTNTKRSVLGDKAAIDRSYRNSANFWWVRNEMHSEIYDVAVDVASRVNALYFQYELTGCYEAAQMTEYHENSGGHYNWHLDMGFENFSAPRKLSMVISLTDPQNYEGGNLEINSGRPQTLEVKYNRAFFFPSFILHRVTPVFSGVRRSMVMWFGGPAFR
jgi:PKHD-type hydroxylase